MKYVFFTYDGIGLPIAYKLQDEGQEVIVAQVKNLEFMPKETPEDQGKRLKLYDGMLQKFDADVLLQKLLKEKNKEEWFIVGDFNYVYPYTERLKKAGFRGLLPTEEDFMLEDNRQLAKELVKNYYSIFKEEESYEFNSVKDALNFLKKRKDKVWGVKGFNPDAQTFFPVSNDAFIAYEELEDVLMIGKEIYEKDGFILEEKIEDLIEFIPELITFDSKIVGASINVELKPFGAGNISVQTGDSASLDFWLAEEEIGRIMDFFPVERLYIRENEMAIWDAGVMYSPSRKAFYFSEFCGNRFVYNSILNKLSTIGLVSEFFEKIVNKQYLFDKTVRPFGCSIRIFNMMSKNGKLKEDLLVVADPADKNTWLWDVYEKSGRYYTVGYEWDIGALTKSGDDWMLNFALIDADLTSTKSLLLSGMYWRRAFDIINQTYQNNIYDRLRFVYNNLLLREFNFQTPREFWQSEDTLKKLSSSVVENSFIKQLRIKQLKEQLNEISVELDKYLQNE